MDWRCVIGDLTEDFSRSEFAQRDPFRPVPAAYQANVQRLADNLQVLRDVVGPITINSSYRTRAKNASLPGSSPTSQHLYAKAADFVVPGVSNAYVYCIVEHLTANGGMEEGGLGWYGETGHIHYDVRGSAARWNKSGGSLPDCTEVSPTPPPQEEDDDMPLVLLQTEGRPEVLRSNGASQWHVPSREVFGQLQALGADAPILIPPELFQAMWETRTPVTHH